MKEAGGQKKRKARRWSKSWPNTEELKGRRRRKQREQLKKRKDKKKLTEAVSWWSRRGAKPCGPNHSHIFISCRVSLSLSLSLPSSLQACNKYIFNYKHRGTEWGGGKKKGRKKGGAPWRSLSESPEWHLRQPGSDVLCRRHGCSFPDVRVQFNHRLVLCSRSGS